MITEHESRIITGPDPNHIVIRLNNVRELMVAPEFDPFSERETEFMGESAITRLIKQLKPGWTRHQRDMHLTILLPRDQITPGIAEVVKGAIQRYCRVKTEDNMITLKNIRWKGIRALPFSFIFLGACIAVGTFLGSGLVSFIPVWLGSALNEGFYIIGWVGLWDPTETLLFDPLPVKNENKILQELMMIQIDIQPA
jgi:hypothetical protein